MTEKIQQQVDTSLYAAHLQRCQATLEAALLESEHERILVHSGQPILKFLDDQYLPYQVNPHFAWWTPLHAPHCGLLLESGKTPILFNYQPVDYWHAAPPATADWWATHFEVRTVEQPLEWFKQIEDNNDLAIITDAPDCLAAFRQASYNPPKLLHKLHLARTYKTAWEQNCIAAANLRAVLGHHAVANAFGQGVSEFDLQMQYLAATSQQENEGPYGNIIALNEHAAILHFTELSRQAPEQVRSLVIDAGANIHGYASDITRTYTSVADSPFGRLINAMDELQRSIIAQVKTGADYVQLHLDTHLKIAEVLHQQDIVNLTPQQQLEEGITSAFLPHGLGHFLGLQVHDVAGLVDDNGSPITPPNQHPHLRLTRTLEVGNVLTIEPGVYFIEQLLEPLRRKNYRDKINWPLIGELMPYGGIRIEDNILVTEGEPRNFTREAFQHNMLEVS